MVTNDALKRTLAIVKQLPDSTLTGQARRKLLDLATANDSIVLFTHQDVITELISQVQSENSQKRFRVHDLTTDLVKISPAALSICIDSGLLSSLIGELSNRDDVLVQLNALELLAQMSADSEETARYLHDAGLIPRLHDTLLDVAEGPDSGFLFPVFELVFNFDKLDIPQRLLGFDTLALIGSTSEGKDQLGNLGGSYSYAMKESMKAFGLAIKDGPIELRARHLEALAMLFTLDICNHTEQRLALVKQWFEWLVDDPYNLLFDLYKKAPMELRLAVGEIIKVLATQSWYQRTIGRQPGFLTFLLDRSTQSEMAGRRLRYDIISTLAESPTIDEIMDENDVNNVKLYYQQGPIFVRIATDIATENGH